MAYSSIFFLHHHIYYPRTTLALPPSSNSDPGSHSGPSSSIPTTVRDFVFVARTLQHFLPPSTRVEMLIYTVKGAYIILKVISPSQSAEQVKITHKSAQPSRIELRQKYPTSKAKARRQSESC